MTRVSLKFFLKDKFITPPLILNVFSFIILFFYLFFSFQKIGDKTIFLHYTINLGVDLVGPKAQIYLLAWGALVIFLLNSVLAYFLYPNQRNLSRIILLVTLAIQCFLWMGAFFLVFINI